MVFLRRDFLPSLFPFSGKKKSGLNKTRILIGKWRHTIQLHVFPMQKSVPPDWKIRPRIEHPALDFHQSEKEKRNTYSVNVN